jgi:hypothetical protein
MKYSTVEPIWDDKASVWLATSDDIPGLTTEAEIGEALTAPSSSSFLNHWNPAVSLSRRFRETTPLYTNWKQLHKHHAEWPDQ